MQRPLLRDLIFFILAGFWAFVVIWDGVIKLWETLGFLVLYVVYILVVVIGRYVNQRIKYGDNTTERKNDFSSASTSGEARRNMNLNVALYDEERAEEEYENEEITRPLLTKTHHEELPELEFNAWDAIKATFTPFEKEDWKTSGFFLRVMIIVKIPVMILLKLTIPLVDYDAPNHNWNKGTTIVNCLTAPVYTVFAIKIGMNSAFGVMPVWGIALILGAISALMVFFFTKLHEVPRFHWVNFEFINSK